MKRLTALILTALLLLGSLAACAGGFGGAQPAGPFTGDTPPALDDFFQPEDTPAFASADGNYVAVVQQGPYWGVIDSAGNWVVEPKFKKLFPFGENGLAQAIVYVGGDTLYEGGFIDPAGNWVIGPGKEYPDFDYRFNADGYCPVSGGVMDQKGNWVVPKGTFYIGADFAQYPLTPARQDRGKWGYIDPQGNWVIQPKFDEDLQLLGCRFTAAGIAGIADAADRTIRFIDTQGNYITDRKFKDVAYNWRHGYQVVQEVGDGIPPYHMLDVHGNYVFEDLGRPANSFGFSKDGLALFENYDGQYDRRFFIDTQGNVVLDISNVWYEVGNTLQEMSPNTHGFCNGYSYAEFHGVYSYIDLQGNFAMEPRPITAVHENDIYPMFHHDLLDVAENGLVAYWEGAKIGFMTPQGEVVIEAQFDDAWPFQKIPD